MMLVKINLDCILNVKAIKLKSKCCSLMCVKTEFYQMIFVFTNRRTIGGQMGQQNHGRPDGTYISNDYMNVVIL